MKKKLVLDSLATTVYHHKLDCRPEIVVIEQHHKAQGIIDYTLKIKHFGEFRTENPIRIYTNVEKI